MNVAGSLKGWCAGGGLQSSSTPVMALLLFTATPGICLPSRELYALCLIILDRKALMISHPSTTVHRIDFDGPLHLSLPPTSVTLPQYLEKYRGVCRHRSRTRKVCRLLPRLRHCILSFVATRIFATFPVLVSNRWSQLVGTTIDAWHASDAEKIGGLDTDRRGKIKIFSVPILLRNIYEMFKRHGILYRLRRWASRLSYEIHTPRKTDFPPEGE